MGMIDNYDIFIFDWDGTITKIRLLNKLNERINPFWKIKKEESKKKFEDLDKKKEFRISKKDLESIEKFEVDEEKRYRILIDLIVFFAMPKPQDQIVKILKLLKKENKKIVVFSNGGRWRIVREAKKLNVSHYFDMIVSAQDSMLLKPNPYCINVILKKFKLKKKKAVYVGDMIDDVLASKFAEIDSCVISSGLDDYSLLKAEKPKYLFRNMEEFYKNL